MHWWHGEAEWSLVKTEIVSELLEVLYWVGTDSALVFLEILAQVGVESYKVVDVAGKEKKEMRWIESDS